MFAPVWAALKTLFVANPMYVEVQREKKKAMAEHNWRGAQLAARVLLLVIYLFLLILTLRYVEYVEPFVLMYVMLGLATILIPAGLHGAIAGDREKRSLDMLLVAPVTPGQIIIGKYAKTFLSLVLLIVAVGAPALIIEVVRDSSIAPRNDLHIPGMLGYLRSLLLVIATTLCMGGLTMWISSKTRSNSGAMLATVGALFVVLVVVPSIGAVMRVIAPDAAHMLVSSNPFVLLFYAYNGTPDYLAAPYYTGADQIPPDPALYLWPVIALMTLLTGAFLFFATENLRNIARGRVDS
jgi:ABC-type transport system involved in multi-copper enzyme maturation permease subunit